MYKKIEKENCKSKKSKIYFKFLKSFYKKNTTFLLQLFDFFKLS